MKLEDQKVVNKLEEIFMPYMATGKYEISNNSDKYIHYTSAENALNILKSKELWLRSTSCMNDYMEISHGYQQLLNFFSNKKNKQKFICALDSYSKGISKKVFDGFDNWWAKIRDDTFIASISVHQISEDKYGRLSMWRAYGSGGGMAALVINRPPENNKLNVILSPVAYFSDIEVEKYLLQIIDNIGDNSKFLETVDSDTIYATVIMALIILAVCLKHPGFKEEQEWRLIYLPTMASNNEWIKKSIETINGIPQIVYKLPFKNDADLQLIGLSIPELLDKILIGPTEYPLAMYNAFCEKLKKLGVENYKSRVVVSDIPLRT